MQDMMKRFAACAAPLILAACAPQASDTSTTSQTTVTQTMTARPAATAQRAGAGVVAAAAPQSTPATAQAPQQAVPTPVPQGLPSVAPPSALPPPGGLPAGPATSASPAPSSLPSATPVPQSTHQPASTAAPIAAPDAAPQIVSYSVSSTTVHSGDTITGHVTTSSNVASVVAQIAGYGMPMAKTGVGQFDLSYTVPRIPFFLHRDYPLTIIARNTRGDTDTRTISISVR